MSLVSLMYGTDGYDPSVAHGIIPEHFEILADELRSNYAESWPVWLTGSDIQSLETIEERIAACRKRIFRSAAKPPLYRRLELSGAPSGWGERTQKTVQSCLKKANHLMGQGKYVFTHSHTLSIAAVTDLLTDFQLGSNRAVTDRVWRVAGVSQPLNNTGDFRKSSVHGKPDRLWTHSVLSVDGDLTRTRFAESALYFLKARENIVTRGDGPSSFFYIRASELVQTSGIQSQYYKKIFLQDLYVFFYRIQDLGAESRINLIAIPRLLLKSPKTCFVYRSHTYGKECRCPGDSQKKFIDDLQKAQAGVSTCKRNLIVSSLKLC
jgi:hypothetical protein